MNTNIAERKLKSTVGQALYTFTQSSQSPCDLNSTIHILWMKKLSSTDVTQFIINNSWDLISGLEDSTASLSFLQYSVSCGT